MWKTKAVALLMSLILLVAAKFCICQAHIENKVGHHSRIESQGPCKNEYKKYSLNGGERFYIVDENSVSCNCAWLYGGN